MYLIFFEDFIVRKSTAISAEDLENCNNGYLEIIDISNPEKPVSYYHGKWKDMLD